MAQDTTIKVKDAAGATQLMRATDTGTGLEFVHAEDAAQRAALLQALAPLAAILAVDATVRDTSPVSRSTLVGTTAIQLMPANANRRFCHIQNQGTGNLYLSFGNTASPDQSCLLLQPGMEWHSAPNHIDTGAISAVSSVANLPVFAREGPAVASTTGGTTNTTPTVQATTGNVVVVGDSIAYGYKADYGWPTRLAFPSGVTVNNTYAQTGHAVGDIPADLPSGVSGLYVAGRNNVVIFQRGTNDIRGDKVTSGAQLYQLVSPYVAQYQAAGFNVVLCTLTPATDDGAGNAQERSDYNALVRANTAGADAILDFAADAVMGAATAPNNTSLYVDQLHPTDHGQDLLAADAHPAINTALLLAARTPTSGSTSTPTGSSGGTGTTTPAARASSFVGTNLTMVAPTYAASATGFGQQLIGGYGTIPQTAGIPAGNTWSIEAFFSIAAAPSRPAVLSSQEGRYAISVSSDGRLQANVQTSAATTFLNGGGYGGGGTGPVVTDGQRHHVALVASGAMATLYLDGASVGTTSLSGAATASSPLGVACHGPDPADYAWTGSLDEVAIFNTARTVTVPTAPYNWGTTGIVELWHLDGSGNAATT